MKELTRTVGMEHYKVTLSEQEKGDLQAITGKDTYAASKVINP
jgi:nitric oxide reductase activation protein